jgi:hypothetical protein
VAPDEKHAILAGNALRLYGSRVAAGSVR